MTYNTPPPPFTPLSTRLAAPGGPSDGPDRATVVDRVRAHVADLLGEDDPDFTADLVATFVQTAQTALAEVEAALGAGDASALGAAAHQLRGSASNVGLTDLTDRWAEIDEAVRRGDGDPSAGEAGAAVRRALAETGRAVALLAE